MDLSANAMQENRFAVFKFRVTVRAHMIKYVTVVQRCRPRLNLAMEKTTRSRSHTKTTVKSPNATRTRFVALRGKIASHCVANDTVS